jgi:hypothetical protein
MRASHALAAAIAAVTLGAAGAARAANWEFVPRLELGYEYNDNYRLDFPGHEIDVSGALLDVTLPVNLVDPTTRLELGPRLRSTFFPDKRSEDSNDYFFNGLFEKRTLRHVFGIDGQWSREDVVRSELPSSEIDSNLGDPTTADAGRRLLRNVRDLIRLDPYWHFDVSQRHRTELGGYYLDVDFKKVYLDPAERQEDFRDYGVYAGWGFRFTERSTLTLRGRASRYETTFDSQAYGAEAEWRSDYTQTANVYLRLGAQRTKLERSNSENETTFIGGLGGRWIWPTTNLFADLTHSVGPTSAGAVVERSQLRLRMTRAVQPRLSVIAGLRGTHDQAIRSTTYPDRDYLTGDLGFDWRITQRWSLVGMYSYIWQEYSDEPSDRSSNAISLGVVYAPGRVE